MDFSMFIEFPGILVLIGVILLLLSIIVIIIAYKTVEEPNYQVVEQVDEKKTELDENNFDINSEVVDNKILNQDTFTDNKMNFESVPEETKVFDLVKDDNEKEIISVPEIPKVEEKIDVFENEFNSSKQNDLDFFNNQYKDNESNNEKSVPETIKEVDNKEDEEEIEIL